MLSKVFWILSNLISLLSLQNALQQNVFPIFFSSDMLFLPRMSQWFLWLLLQQHVWVLRGRNMQSFRWWLQWGLYWALYAATLPRVWVILHATCLGLFQWHVHIGACLIYNKKKHVLFSPCDNKMQQFLYCHFIEFFIQTSTLNT